MFFRKFQNSTGSNRTLHLRYSHLITSDLFRKTFDDNRTNHIHPPLHFWEIFRGTWATRYVRELSVLFRLNWKQYFARFFSFSKSFTIKMEMNVIFLMLLMLFNLLIFWNLLLFCILESVSCHRIKRYVHSEISYSYPCFENKWWK